VVHYLPGTGSRLVLSLAGVGRDRGHVPPMEFIGTASQGGENHVLFISDASRSWMNGPGVAEMLARLVEVTRAKLGPGEVVALGNSMGGFAALALAERVEIGTVVAFAPQYSMNPDLVPEETRWAHFASQITDWPVPDVGRLDSPGTQYFVFHGGNAWEARHWLRFPIQSRLHHFIFDGMGHDVAARLRKRHLLPQVFNAAVRGKPRALRVALERSILGRRFTVVRRETYQIEHPELTTGPEGAPVVVPLGTEDRT
jgi:pimeloyl-ACP methyl ester carboxylesterase